MPCLRIPALLGLVLLLAGGCTPSFDATLSGAEVLAGTQNRHSLLGGAFSLSPDDHYLFGTNYDPSRDLVVEGGPLKGGFIYHLKTMKPVDVVWGEEAEEFLQIYGVVEESGCWEGTSLFVQSPFPPRGLVIDARMRVPGWEVSQQQLCTGRDDVIPDEIELVGGSSGAVTILHRPSGRTLATHSPSLLFGSAVIVKELQLSRNKRWFAYGVLQPHGSFTGNTQAYLVDLANPGSAPLLLASPSGTLRFSDDGEFLYGHVRVSADDRQWVIVRWALSQVR